MTTAMYFAVASLSTVLPSQSLREMSTHWCRLTRVGDRVPACSRMGEAVYLVLNHRSRHEQTDLWRDQTRREDNILCRGRISTRPGTELLVPGCWNVVRHQELHMLTTANGGEEVK